MEILNRKILSKYKREIVLFSFGILYFFFLLRYYLIEYYVPDFRLYFNIYGSMLIFLYTVFFARICMAWFYNWIIYCHIYCFFLIRYSNG